MPASNAIASLQKQFPGKVGQLKEFRDEQYIEIDRDIIHAVAAHLKGELGFNLLLDISSVDHFGDEPRYEVVYEFCALGGPNNQAHLRVKLKVGHDRLSRLHPSDIVIHVFTISRALRGKCSTTSTFIVG